MVIPAAVTYDLWNPKTRANPQALYAQMRQEDPIHGALGPVTGRRFWFFTRYDDCVAVLKDQRFGKEIQKHLTPEQLVGQPVDSEEFAVINRHLLDLDPPDHSRLRPASSKIFARASRKLPTICSTLSPANASSTCWKPMVSRCRSP